MALDTPEKRQHAKVQDYKKCFKTPEGQAVLKDLVARFVINTPHCPGDSHTSAYNNGMQACVLMIIKETKLDINKIKKMIEEGYDGNRSSDS